MKSSTRDKVKGTAKILKGRAQATAGEAAKKPGLRDRGRATEAAGGVQKKVGDVKKVFDR